MDSTSAAVIINPQAGSRVARDSQKRIDLAWRLLKSHNVSGDVVVTERPGHAREVACDLVKRGRSPIIAWGGDGTVNEVASAVAGRDVSLGIVPGGSGNGLARELGLDRRPERALATALAGRDRYIDVGELDGRLFVNVAGIGLDARVARRFNARSARGFREYLVTVLRELLRYTAAKYTITVDQTRLCRRALIVALANSRQYGGGACIAPNARLDDGFLQLVVVDARSVVASLWAARRLFSGTVHRARGVFTQKAKSVTLSSTEPIGFHVDGEAAYGQSSLTARVHPRALRVRV